jgi:hypothetical protein
VDQQSETMAAGAFAVRDCALLSIATGQSALSAKELHDALQGITLDSVYYHFWGALLEPRFEEREFNNDFAAWARHGLHDGKLAERLAMADPRGFSDLEELRQELLDIIDQRLDENEFMHWVRATSRFEFVRSQIVVFDTGRRVESPSRLAAVLPEFTVSSVFYHFVDARRRTADGRDDFSVWLEACGEQCDTLVAQLGDVDPYFASLAELRRELCEIFSSYFAGREE